MRLCNHIKGPPDLTEGSIIAHAGAQEERNYQNNASRCLLAPPSAAAAILQPAQKLRSDPPTAGDSPLTGRAINQRGELLNPLLVLSVP